MMINQTFNFTAQYKSALMLSSMTIDFVFDVIRLMLTLKPIVAGTNHQ